MSEILLESIVEKLEGLEIALLKKDDTKENDPTGILLLKEVKALQAGITKLASSHSETNEKVQNLTSAIALLKASSGIPPQGKASHTHHLHKGIWVAIALSILAASFLYGWIRSSVSKEKYRANDILYRYLKVNGNRELLKGLYHIDSLYKSNSDDFIKHVEQQEENLAEQVRLMKEAGEKKKEGDELKQSLDKK